MITSKQRSNLASMAQKLDSIFQIGKNGINDELILGLSQALETKELVKITVLKNNEMTSKEAIAILCEKLEAEPIACIGFKVVIYRKSSKKDIEHIKL